MTAPVAPAPPDAQQQAAPPPDGQQPAPTQDPAAPTPAAGAALAPEQEQLARQMNARFAVVRRPDGTMVGAEPAPTQPAPTPPPK